MVMKGGTARPTPHFVVMLILDSEFDFPVDPAVCDRACMMHVSDSDPWGRRLAVI